MKYLGLLAAVVVIVCVFAYVSRMPTSTPGMTNANSYASTINAVRNTVHTAAGAEQRRKWAVAEQMKTYSSAPGVNFSTEGENAETLIATADAMNSMLCSTITDGESGTRAAAIGFTSISCRTSTGGIVIEKDLP